MTTTVEPDLALIQAQESGPDGTGNTTQGTASSHEKNDNEGSDMGRKSANDSLAEKADHQDKKDFEEDTINYPTGLSKALIIIGIDIAVFLFSIDLTIIAPAIPTISNHFQTTTDTAWYTSAYFLTSAGLLPLYARILRYDLKWTFFSAIVWFELGSIICAAAQTSNAFIAGRAVAGVGVAGGYIGAMAIISASVPLHEKPLYTGQLGGVYALAAILGPILGGVFTTETALSWRWCFIINPILGVISFISIIFFLNPPKRTSALQTPWKAKLRELDLSGAVLFMGGIVCILLVFQYGGFVHAWNSSQVIGLIVGFGLFMIAFVINEWFQKEHALIPFRILFQRTVWSASLYNVGIGSAYFSISFFLPIYFQVRGSSALRSGVQTIPLIIGVLVGTIATGALAPKIGYVPPVLYFGGIGFVVTLACFQVLDANSNTATWAALEVAAGISGGSSFQFAFIASQTVLSGIDTETAGSIVLVSQLFGGVLIVGVSQAIYQNYLYNNLLSIPSLTATALAIASAGETGFRDAVPAGSLDLAVNAAIDAIKKSFIPGTVAMGVGLLAVPFVEYNSIANMNSAAVG